MSRRRDLRWRDRAASELLLETVAKRTPGDPVLVMGDPLLEVENGLRSLGSRISGWNRRAFENRAATPWPPPGPFGTVALRLSRAKDELVMSLHQAASVLLPGGEILVYGAKDEGIEGASDRLGEIFTGVTTVAVGGRCRVLRGTLGTVAGSLKGTLDHWRTRVDLSHVGLSAAWVSYPGVFAHGRLDEGTSLLLEALPALPAGARVLDYGCGSGVVGHVVAQKGERVVLHLSDVDAVALEAARENVPEARLHLCDGLPAVGAGPFHAIVSNPPFHRGKQEDPGLVSSLIRGAGELLERDGLLLFVTQRRLQVQEEMHGHFQKVEVVAVNRTFRVWRGTGPRKRPSRGHSDRSRRKV